jgi:2-polyprenyl-3-methyl-5-hydroxy-6-metoxy-1,4-benzoquinol methylase
MKIDKYNSFKTYRQMLSKKTKERFGLDSSFKWNNDPRQFFISLSRYKFVAKMLQGKKNVLEVGCGDGFNSRIVKQEVHNLDISDNGKIFKKYTKITNSKKWNINFFEHDFIKNKSDKIYDAIYFLDVLEHIPQKKEKTFIENILYSLEANGVLVIGIPTLEFQKFSRPKLYSGHINCKTAKKLRSLLDIYFGNVFIYSMNDECVHTGFDKMACYLIAICTNKKINVL